MFFWSPSFVVLPPWRSIDAKPLSVQILICTWGIIFGLWMIYWNLFLKICQKLDLWLPNLLMPILYDELVIMYCIDWRHIAFKFNLLQQHDLQKSSWKWWPIETNDCHQTLLNIYIYIHCWTPISIKCHFQGRSSWLKICYVGKDDGVDYLKPNTTIKMLVWYVLGQFRLCVVSFRPHLMAVRDGFEYWLFCDDLLQNLTRNPWLVNLHLDKPG